MGQLGDLSPQASVAVGILVGLISTSIQSLGLTLQRKSHLLEDEKEIEVRKPPYKRRRWQAGMGMFIASNLIGSTIQITTLPLPVLSTLQASGLVFNTAFATLLLKEPFTRFSAIGTVLTCAGAGLIAAFGAIGEPAHNLQQLLDLLKEKAFVAWMICTLLVAVITIVFAHVLKLYSSHKHISQHWQKKNERSPSTSESQPLLFKRSFTGQLPVPMQLRLSRLRLIRGLSYALISGILSAHSLLMAKSAVELLVRTIVDHNNQFNRFQSWLILLALLFFALSQLYYLHLGLRLCSTSILYPFVFCIYNIVAILDGLIYFKQASLLSGLHAGLIALGTVILLAGVLALSWRLDDATPADAPSQVLPPSTPLTPGMGLVRTSEDAETSPLIQQNASGRRSSSINRRKRTGSSSIQPNTPEITSRDIWAEIDDEEDEIDVLASLPRTTSPYLVQGLNITKQRTGSASSHGRSSISDHSPARNTSRDSNQPRRSMTLQAHPHGGSRRSSISSMKAGSHERITSPIIDSPDRDLSPSPQKQKARTRGHTVHFLADERRSKETKASRWDDGVSKPVPTSHEDAAQPGGDEQRRSGG